jgi:U3 small nucleolar RNA-associated protein 11
LKAALKNKDEFNFRMLKSKVKDGVVYEDEDDHDSGDE